jgi:hypothetical protein
LQVCWRHWAQQLESGRSGQGGIHRVRINEFKSEIVGPFCRQHSDESVGNVLIFSLNLLIKHASRKTSTSFQRGLALSFQTQFLTSNLGRIPFFKNRLNKLCSIMQAIPPNKLHASISSYQAGGSKNGVLQFALLSFLLNSFAGSVLASQIFSIQSLNSQQVCMQTPLRQSEFLSHSSCGGHFAPALHQPLPVTSGWHAQ